MTLNTNPTFPDPDAAYRLIVQAHRTLPPAAHAQFDAALTLLLANHIGDITVLAEAIAAAHQAIEGKQ